MQCFTVYVCMYRFFLTNFFPHLQQSDEEQSSSQSNKSSQPLALPNPPPSGGPNGQVPIVPPAVTTLSTQPTTWNTLSTTVASLMGQMQSAFPNNQQFPQTQTSFQPQQPSVGMTTFTLADPLQALQKIRAATAVQPLQTQYTTTSQQQLYSATTLQNPSQTMIPRMVQPGAQLIGGVYPQPQYTSAQPNYQSQVKAQQPYSLLGQTGVVQQTAGGQGYAVNPGQVAYPPSLLPRVGGTQPNNVLSQNTYTTPYHQSTIPQGTKAQLVALPQQQIHQNTSYTNYGTQTASYLPPGGVGVQGSAQPPPQVGGVSGQLMPGRTPVYPPTARGHTPNKPGSGRWGMR